MFMDDPNGNLKFGSEFAYRIGGGEECDGLGPSPPGGGGSPTVSPLEPCDDPNDIQVDWMFITDGYG